MEVASQTDCNGYLEWYVTKVTLYNETTGKPNDSTNDPVSERNIPWMSKTISYGLASILFQIRSDEQPYDKDVNDLFESDIRTYAIIKPELEFCKCATWSEEEHTAFCEAMDEFASLGLRLNIVVLDSECLCKIPNEYEIPKSGKWVNRRWEPKVDE